MKRINIIIALFLLVYTVKAQHSQSEIQNLASFGDEINADNALDTSEMTEKYQILTANDTLQTKFTARVTEVCQSMGCWMKLELQDGSNAMVRFKDYGFFMPKDISGKEVIVNGKAFVEEMSVEDQKHFAKDGGKSKEDIAQITKTKKTYGFEADGVLIKN